MAIMLRSLATAISLTLLAGCSTVAGRKARLAEELGSQLGGTFVQSARLMAEAGIQDETEVPECTSSLGHPALREYCSSAASQAERVADRLNRAYDSGALDPNDKYGLTHDQYLFRELRTGLVEEHPLVRRHLIYLSWSLCEGGTFLTRAGRSECRAEVQAICSATLLHDADDRNQILALTILADAGYATQECLDALKAVHNNTTNDEIRVLANQLLSTLGQ